MRLRSARTLSGLVLTLAGSLALAAPACSDDDNAGTTSSGSGGATSSTSSTTSAGGNSTSTTTSSTTGSAGTSTVTTSGSGGSSTAATGGSGGTSGAGTGGAGPGGAGTGGAGTGGAGGAAGAAGGKGGAGGTAGGGGTTGGKGGAGGTGGAVVSDGGPDGTGGSGGTPRDGGDAAVMCPAGTGPVPAEGGIDDTNCLEDGGRRTQVADECPTVAPDAADEDPPPPHNGTEADDDDCKYHVKYSITCVERNQNVTFTITPKATVNGAAVTGAKPSIEGTIGTHPLPNSGVMTTENNGVYTVGPVRFDRQGKWTVRFHFFETCEDGETSKHSHVAFYINVN